MRIAIPVSEGKLSAHFGHCEAFALIDVDAESGEVTGQTLAPSPPHQPGMLPGWLAEQGANLIIAGGMGQRAQTLFQQVGVDVIIGAPPEAPETLVQAYCRGNLASGANPCDH
jgi:predicted Fe-Mo cluster-binding NifX family protein